MIQPRYLRVFGIAALISCALYLTFTLIVDPYGVSPLRASWEHVNRFKPKRIDIDRLIKPYEVWRYQPKTVFLGTSRTQQAFDPSVLDGTRFASAYNASIPASSVALNVSHLQQFVDLDPHLRAVIVELFFYQFIGENLVSNVAKPYLRKTIFNFMDTTKDLFISSDTLFASFHTLNYNLIKSTPTFEIAPRGNLYYPSGQNLKAKFDGFPTGIWNAQHTHEILFPNLNEQAFDDFVEIIRICREHYLELVFVLAPNHAYDDYRLEATGVWPKIEEWLRRISAVATVYSFSQPNEWVYEPVSAHTKYWNDPLHFTLEMGRNIQLALAGLKVEDAPENFMVLMTPDIVAAHIQSRRDAIHRWMEGNRDFVEEFQKAKRKWETAHKASNK